MPGDHMEMRAIQIRSRRAVAISLDGRQYLSLESLCRPFGLSTFAMWKIIQNNVGLRHFAREIEDLIAGTPLLCLDREAVEAWITLIPEDAIPVAVRDEHRHWCIEVVRAAHSLRTLGVAVNREIIGPEDEERINEIALQARTESLRVAEASLRTATQLMPDDPVVISLARINFKTALWLSSGDAAPREKEEQDHGSIRWIGVRHGYRLTPEAVSKYLARPVLAEYRRLHGGDPQKSDQLGLPPEPGAHSLTPVAVNCFPREDWGWIVQFIEEAIQKHGKKVGQKVRRLAA